jgi:hypothetical protein
VGRGSGPVKMCIGLREVQGGGLQFCFSPAIKNPSKSRKICKRQFI